MDFAFETTLASRTPAAWIRRLRQTGYRFSLVFLWLPSDELAVQRVAARVHAGGHDVPEATVRRRYHAGLKNFFTLYKPIADHWRFYDNSTALRPRLIASGSTPSQVRKYDAGGWQKLRENYDDEQRDQGD